LTNRLNPLTTEDLEEIERCFNRIQLTLLMAAAVVMQPEVFLEARTTRR
jgi:hypothetical protein